MLCGFRKILTQVHSFQRFLSKKKKELGSVTFLSNQYKQPRGLGLRNYLSQLRLTYEWVLP